MKSIFLLLTFVNLVNLVFGQDPQFTQFYAAPLYHNSAFTGSGYAPRIILNYRNQWPSLNANFVTQSFSIDHFIEKANSGVGLMVLNDAQGNRFKNTEITGLYSYQLKVSETNHLRFGLQGSYSMRGFDSNGLVFGDQIGNSGIFRNYSIDRLANLNFNSAKKFDVGSGLLFYNKNYFVGFAANHLASPKFKFLGDSASVKFGTIEHSIDRKYMVHGGYNISLNQAFGNSNQTDREFTLTPTFLYKKQGEFSQLDLGAYVTYTPLTLGLQYRGIPLKKVFSNFPNQDAIAALVGFRYDNFSIGYSYDLTISGLGPQSGGSHEISLSYQLDKFDNDKSPYLKQRKKELACPKF
jgi:type IX secretion system PorP/SprF family membrane protein